MSIFFIADTHFGDERILRYENRPFLSVERINYTPFSFDEIKRVIAAEKRK